MSKLVTIFSFSDSFDGIEIVKILSESNRRNKNTYIEEKVLILEWSGSV